MRLACDTFLIVTQEAFYCYPTRYCLLHSPQHSWGIRFFIYEILPIYDNVQQHLLFQAFYFIEKYDLADMRAMFESFDKVMAHNKNLGLLSSKVLQNLLSAYTQNEYLRGIKVSTLNNVTDVQQE